MFYSEQMRHIYREIPLKPVEWFQGDFCRYQVPLQQVPGTFTELLHEMSLKYQASPWKCYVRYQVPLRYFCGDVTPGTRYLYAGTFMEWSAVDGEAGGEGFDFRADAVLAGVEIADAVIDPAGDQIHLGFFEATGGDCG